MAKKNRKKKNSKAVSPLFNVGAEFAVRDTAFFDSPFGDGQVWEIARIDCREYAAFLNDKQRQSPVWREMKRTTMREVLLQNASPDRESDPEKLIDDTLQRVDMSEVDQEEHSLRYGVAHFLVRSIKGLAASVFSCECGESWGDPNQAECPECGAREFAVNWTDVPYTPDVGLELFSSTQQVPADFVSSIFDSHKEGDSNLGDVIVAWVLKCAKDTTAFRNVYTAEVVENLDQSSAGD